MSNNQLNERFIKFKKTLLNNDYKFGKYWEKEKKTFNVDFKDGLFYSTGSRDYLPRIYDKNIDESKIIPINGKKFIQLGEKKLCTLKDIGSTHLLHTYHYFDEIKDFLKYNDTSLEIGKGIGFL